MPIPMRREPPLTVADLTTDSWEIWFAGAPHWEKT
jgi:hypothetical protein